MHKYRASAKQLGRSGDPYWFKNHLLTEIGDALGNCCSVPWPLGGGKKRSNMPRKQNRKECRHRASSRRQGDKWWHCAKSQGPSSENNLWTSNCTRKHEKRPQRALRTQKVKKKINPRLSQDSQVNGHGQERATFSKPSHSGHSASMWKQVLS